MTPRDVDALTDEEYDALVRFLERDARDQKRAAARARKR
jgi:hypothetical protein